MIKLRHAFIALILFAQTSAAWPVEFGIAHPRVLGSQRQSYFERPDILQVEAREHPELQWQAWREAHLEAAAAFLELYPTEHLYFLARDAELLYDAVRLISRDDPQTLSRLHLLNVSRANMRDEHLLEYLAQEGITPERLRSDPSFQPIFIDTGFSGTIPRVIAERMPEDVRGRIRTHLLVSSNSAMPSLRSFLHPVNPAINGQSPSSMHGTIVGYEHIARATDRSNAYQRIRGEWHPVSRTHSRSDGPVSAFTALRYQQDLKSFLESSVGKTIQQERRQLWRALRSQWLTLSSEQWTEFLQAQLARAGNARPRTEAAIRDFLEWARLIGSVNNPNAPSIVAEIGLSQEAGAQLSNKFQLITQFPQWAPILENPDLQIPVLLDAGQIGTLGAILDVIQDVEIRQIAIQEIAKRLEVVSVYALTEALIENIENNDWVISLFYQRQSARHPELLQLAIEKAAPTQMATFVLKAFNQTHWWHHFELLRLAIEKATPDQMETFFEYVNWPIDPVLLRLAIEKTPPDRMGSLARNLLHDVRWTHHPELLRLAIEKTAIDQMESFVNSVFAQPHWSSRPQIGVFRIASILPSSSQRRVYLREQLGAYPWEADVPGICEQQMLTGESL